MKSVITGYNLELNKKNQVKLLFQYYAYLPDHEIDRIYSDAVAVLKHLREKLENRQSTDHIYDRSRHTINARRCRRTVAQFSSQIISIYDSLSRQALFLQEQTLAA